MSRRNINTNQNSNSTSLTITKIITSVLFAYIITFLIFIVFAALMTYSDFSENHIPSIVTATTIIGVLMSGILLGRRTLTRGWFNGAIGGVSYVVILYILSIIILKNAAISKQLINMLIIGMVVGALGGIIGINLRRRR